MKVLIVEDNLMWSERLRRGAAALGHQAIVSAEGRCDATPDLALVNLGLRKADAGAIVRSLKARGVRVIGHAGHKEKDLLATGEAAGCDRIVSNGTLAARLADVLNLANIRD